MTDINGYATDALTVNGIETDDYTTSLIDLVSNNIVLTATNINLNSDTLLYNSLPLLTSAGLQALETKTQNITASVINESTNFSGAILSDIVNAPNIVTEIIINPLATSSIEFSTGAINITSGTLNLNNNSVVSTPYDNELEATSFKKTGGTNQQYLMGDGSVLQYSANSGNSNFYLYKSHSNTPTPPPTNGFLYYNNSNQSLVTIVYISHVTDDGIDIEVFFNNISQLNDLYIQQKSISDNFIRYNITGAPTITTGSMIAIPVIKTDSAGSGSTSFGVNEPILISFFTNTIETDIRISAVESDVTTLQTKTQNQTAISGTTTFSGAGGILGQKFIKSGGLTTQFLKANGDVDSKTYIESGPINNSSVPYINTTGAVASSNSNLYVQAGVNTVQSALDAIISGQARSIQLSSGSFVENITLSKQNYILAGASCPLFAPTTQVLGNITIGLTGVLTTRQKIKDIIFTNNLTFFSDATNQALRTTVSNCEFQGSITFPALAVAGTFIYFFDCSFSGAAGTYSITFPATQNYVIVFTRCNFSNQTFVNNATLDVLNTFRDCTGMSSITLSPATYFGINALTTAVSNVTTTSLVLGGTTTSLLKGNGTSLTGTSSQFVMGDASLNSSSYSFRKFMLKTAQTVNGSRTNNSILGSVASTLLPASGNAFISNEGKIGDVYNIVVWANIIVPVLANIPSFTFSLFGGSIQLLPTTQFTTTLANVKLTFDVSIVSATGSIMSGSMYVGTATPFTVTSVQVPTVNLTLSSSADITYTQTGGGAGLTIYHVSFIKY